MRELLFPEPQNAPVTRTNKDDLLEEPVCGDMNAECSTHNPRADIPAIARDAPHPKAYRNDAQKLSQVACAKEWMSDPV